jgi:hypothetical protein
MKELENRGSLYGDVKELKDFNLKPMDMNPSARREQSRAIAIPFEVYTSQ